MTSYFEGQTKGIFVTGHPLYMIQPVSYAIIVPLMYQGYCKKGKGYNTWLKGSFTRGHDVIT